MVIISVFSRQVGFLTTGWVHFVHLIVVGQTDDAGTPHTFLRIKFFICFLLKN